MSEPIDNANPIDEHNELLRHALKVIHETSDRYGDYCARIAGDAAERIAYLERQLAAVTAERDGLRAIVDRLPKTADGVPVVPGDEVFHCEWTEPRRILVFRCNGDDEYITCAWRESGNDGDPPEYVAEAYYQESDVGYYATFCKPVSECYSTREAAEAAKENDRV